MQNGNANLKIYTVIQPDDEGVEQLPQRNRIKLGLRKGVARKSALRPAAQTKSALSKPVQSKSAERRSANHKPAKPKAAMAPSTLEPHADVETAEEPTSAAAQPVRGPRLYSSAQAARHKPITQKARPKMGATEKLMRNSAIACALLLTVLALQNVNQPWTQATLGTIKNAVTMRIDLDESLGRLNFVRGLVPDSAQVFWSMGAQQLQLPVNGTIAHEYADMQPWVEFVCKAQEPVVAAERGIVTAVGQGSQGDWTLMIDHDGGMQTVYAYMSAVLVKVGQQVDKGAQLGLTADQETSRLYFEMRENGQSKNPGTLMQQG